MAKATIRFKRILCAVDFSPASLRSLDYALELASANKAQVRLVHIIPRIVASVMDIPITTSKWTAAQEEKAKRELPKLKERAARKGVSASTEIRLGDIDVQLLKAAKDFRADVLAMGTHGHKGFERWIIGSVAERMLRHSPIPLLVTGFSGKRAGTGMRRILIATDFSKGTGDAVGYGASIAAQAKASMVMLHVIQDRTAAVDWSEFPDQTAAIRQKLSDLVPASVRGQFKVEARVESGEPYRVILKTIQDLKPSLVILNTHGYGFVDRVLIGSTAERVVRGGAEMCPMLLIPPQ